MNYWLIKSEPFKYSWQQLLQDKKTCWDKVRNYAARNNLKAMKTGDLLLFYHSNEGLEIVGVATVVKENYPDPTTDDAAWVAVDVAPVVSLGKPLGIKQIKQDELLKNMEFVRLSRLSVSRVSSDEFHRILALTETTLPI